MRNVFEDPKYKGGALLGLPTSGMVKTPTASEISMNYVWLLPIVMHYPSKVPSAYLLTDAFLVLDKRMEKKLFRPSRELNETRMGLAAVEAVKAKRLLGALRSLWRSSPGHGQDTRITHLKSYLMQSPNRRAGRAALPDAGEAPAAAAAPAAEQDEESEGDESRGDESGGDERGGDESGGDESGGHESESDEKEGDESGDSEVEMLGPSAPTSPGDGARDDSSSDVYAPTLRLDDCRDPSPPYQMVEACSSESDSSDGESPKDSQVPGAGWMGKAMMNARHLEREEAEQAELEQRLGHLLGVIQESLERQLGNEHTLDGTLWHQYEKWCYEAMKDHGEQAFDKLSQLEFFQRWVREQKATPAEDRAADLAEPNVPQAAKPPAGSVKRGSSSGEEVIITPAAKRPKFAGDVAKGLQLTPPPVCGPQTAKHMSNVKADDKMAELGGEKGTHMKTFHEYDLVAMGIPVSARPIAGVPYLGKHGYTLKSSTGAVVECLLKNKAFVVKKVANDHPDPSGLKKGQMTWSKFGGVDGAWLEAVERSGFSY